MLAVCLIEGSVLVETTKDVKFGGHVVQIPLELSFCAGCRSCEVICGLVHDKVTGPTRQRLTVKRDIRMMTHEVLTCRHCADHPCYNACPKKDEAMIVGDDGIAVIVDGACIGCGLCHKACRFTPSRINFIKELPRDVRKARKCDMCRERESGPACVEWCPVRCLEVK